MPKDERNTAIHMAYEDFVPLDPAVPEKNLLRAVLLSAMNDLKKPGEVGAQAKRFFITSDENYLFSFQAICTQLELDPNQVMLVVGLSEEQLLPDPIQPEPQVELPLSIPKDFELN